MKHVCGINTGPFFNSNLEGCLTLTVAGLGLVVAAWSTPYQHFDKEPF
jgi:hypothetical protein